METTPDISQYTSEREVTQILHMGRDALMQLPQGEFVHRNFFLTLLLQNGYANQQHRFAMAEVMYQRLGRELLPHVVDAQTISPSQPLPQGMPKTINESPTTALLTLADTTVKKARASAQVLTTQGLSQEIVDAYQTSHRGLFDYDTLWLLHLANCTSLSDPNDSFSGDVVPQPNRTLVGINFGSSQQDGGSFIIDPLFEQPGEQPQLKIVHVPYLGAGDYCTLGYGSTDFCIRSIEQLKPLDIEPSPGFKLLPLINR